MGSEICNKLSIDEACLSIYNDDLSVRDVWAQADECFECLPWKYLSIKPGDVSYLKVNTTYATNIFIRPSHAFYNIYKYKYHFVQHGIYEAHFNSSHFGPFSVTKFGNNEYTAILAMFLFFFFLHVFWLGVNVLQKKLGESRRVYRISDSNTPSLLIAEENEAYTGENSANPQTTTSPASGGGKERLNSLDTFRGMAITIMIFVNYKGGMFYFFKHSPWNGITVADLVFPWFMWIMGVSLTFSIKSQLMRGDSFFVMVFRILKRSFSLFALGIVINSLHTNYLPDLRILGVLQRFSICYLVNAFLEMLFMKLPEATEHFRGYWIRDILWAWAQWLLISLLVVFHSVISFKMRVPGCPSGYLGPGGMHKEGNYPNCTGGATGYIDRLIFGEHHIHKHPSCKNIYDCFLSFDPEGLLGNLTSCLTVQLGVAAGRIILYYSGHFQRIRRWILWSFVLGLIGGILCKFQKEGGCIPLNKNLWSLSFVCVTASFAFILLAVLYFIIDVRKYSDGGILKIAGMNSILLYVGHEITKRLFPWSWSPVKQNHASYLLMSVWGTFLWLLISYVCHRKKLYFSV